MADFRKDQWDEFAWEKELKKDDRRIEAYMQELPRYIDLPSEDDLIMKRVMEKPELIPVDGMISPKDIPDEFFPEEESFPITDDWQKQPGSDFYMACCRLARMWALSFAADPAEQTALHGTRVLCLYGAVMARSWDLIEMEEHDYIALRIALCKRLLALVNALLGEFRFLAESDLKIASSAELHYGQMLIFRNKVLQMLHSLRFPKEKNSSGNAENK